MKAYTDYPFMPSDSRQSPIREVVPISYDGDKYVVVMYDGDLWSFKAGYLYSESGRLGEVPNYPIKTLPVDEAPDFE